MSTISLEFEGMDYLNPNPTRNMLRMARITAGIDYEEAARLCGIEESYYRKMESSGGGVKVKLSVYRLMLCRAGYMIHPGWEGWRIREGLIWSPVGSGHTPGDILSINWLDQSLRSLRAELFQKTGQRYDQDWYHGYQFREYEA